MKETCLALVGENETECGEPSVARIIVRTKQTSARVPVCSIHKARHDRGFAAMRTSSSTSR